MEKPPHLQTRNADLQLVAAAEDLMKANPHRDVHAAATWNVADRLMRMLRGRDFYQRPREPSPQTIELCRKYLTKMEREYPEYEHFIYGTYGKAADRLLYDLETMLVGKTPPNLVAEDVTGKTVKLSDYRGKLVIVDFWSSRMNHNPATDGYSSLKAILEKAGDRVAVLGVVSASPEDVKKEIQEHQIDYPVFADGEDGPLFKLWNIQAWPTLFLLDENGVILYRGGRGNSLENLLLEKLAERKQASNVD
jgi:peroxiredoxin